MDITGTEGWVTENDEFKVAQIIRSSSTIFDQDKIISARYIGRTGISLIFDVVVSALPANEVTVRILKCPCDGSKLDQEPEDSPHIVASQIALLKWLRKNTRLPFPDVHFYDTDMNNPIGSAYMVLDKNKGGALEDILPYLHDLTVQERVSLARAVGRFIEICTHITLPRAGMVVPANSHPELVNHDDLIAVQPLGTWSRSDHYDTKVIDLSRLKKPRLPLAVARYEPPWLSVLDTLMNAFDRRMDTYEAREDADKYTQVVELLEKGRSVMWRLEAAGYFKHDVDFTMWNPNLLPSNILVEFADNSDGLDYEKIITGILEYGETMFLPGFAVCRPPVWLWAPNVAAYDVHETTGWSLTKPESPELLQMKAVFDEAVGDWFVKRAYGRGYIYARALLGYVRLEVWSERDLSQMQELLEECEEWMRSGEFTGGDFTGAGSDGTNEGGDADDGHGQDAGDVGTQNVRQPDNILKRFGRLFRGLGCFSG